MQEEILKEKSLPIPHNETGRLAQLDYYEIMDSEDEAMFDELTQLAAQVLDVPICLMSLVGENRQWFKSKQGLDATETPRDISFCQYAIMGDEVMEVQDATKDERFKENPLVTDGLKIKFYAGAPLKDDQGYAIGTICAIDQEEKKITEHQRRTLATIANTAMNMVALRRKRIEAERLALAKDEFLSNMSHEIRTPLNAIIGFNDLINKTPLNAKQKDYLDTIYTSAQNLKVIVNDILDFSKLESGKLQVEDKAIDLRKIVAHVGKLQGPIAKEKGLKFITSFDEDVPRYVKSDETRLMQILVNLLSNAIKFTHKGRVEMRTYLEAINEEEALVSITVCDTGIGIAPEKQDYVFERFTQSTSSTTRLYGGTGLGLSIVKMLVNLLGGDITLKSELGVGSEFEIKLPFAIADANETKNSIEILDQNLSKDLTGKRILVVEDNPNNQLLIKNYLNIWGMFPDIANNGKKGVKMAIKNNYDAIFMDLQMPIMDGFEATMLIRERLGSKIPIIGCSAHSLVGEKEKCLAIGMDDYVAKPYTEKELIETLFKYITNEEASSSEVDDFSAVLHEMATNYSTDFVHEVGAVFLKSAPEGILELQEALSTNNFKEIEQRVHFFAGTYGSLGFEIGRVKFKSVENKIAKGSYPEMKQDILGLIEYLDNTVLAVQTFLEN
jgi:signal transduction histidine kinase/DNA-binding NarL/FixJ family response regulator